MRTRLLVVALVSLGLLSTSGCIFSSKPKTTSQPQAVESEPKNHGQERKEEVHERNEERKAEKDADKAAKKDEKK